MEATAASGVKYKPKFGRVLIKREIVEKTSGGIIIPENAAKRQAACDGVIVALGETAGFTESFYENETGVLTQHTIQTMKVGDKVIFGRHSGAWLDGTYSQKGDHNDDGSLFICQDQDILAVIQE
jgi:co-chaperonin GroES (HSP10)